MTVAVASTVTVLVTVGATVMVAVTVTRWRGETRRLYASICQHQHRYLYSERKPLTVAPAHQRLELVAVLVGGTALLAIVGGLVNADGAAEESAAHEDVGLRVGAGRTRLYAGGAQEVDVDCGMD